MGLLACCYSCFSCPLVVIIHDIRIRILFLEVLDTKTQSPAGPLSSAKSGASKLWKVTYCKSLDEEQSIDIWYLLIQTVVVRTEQRSHYLYFYGIISLYSIQGYLLLLASRNIKFKSSRSSLFLSFKATYYYWLQEISSSSLVRFLLLSFKWHVLSFFYITQVFPVLNTRVFVSIPSHGGTS